MSKIPYDATRKSLYQPGEADNFFKLGCDLTDEKVLCAEMARLAYVKEKDRLKTYLDRAGFDLHCAVGYGAKGTQLFIAKTKTNPDKQQLVVVAFRGTESDDLLDLLSDAILFKKPWLDVSGKMLGKVHTGFATALLNDPNNKNILEKIHSQLNDLATQSPRILLTGHSLGAALATLTVSYLNQAPLSEKIYLYTFGSPRVGNRSFSRKMTTSKHLRYVNCCDLVTRIPIGFGYRHVGTKRYIDRYGHINESITCTGIIVDRLKATAVYLVDYSFIRGTVWIRKLADHSPINYLSGVAGLRA